MNGEPRAPSLTVVILNYNDAQDVVRCVESIERCGEPTVRVLVVDNASTDDSVAELRRRLPDLDLIRSRRNEGFAAGSNLGIRRALVEGSEWILLLNPDTTVRPEFFREFFRFTRERPDVRAAGGVGLYTSDPERIWFGGGWFDWRRGRGECAFQGEPLERLPDPSTPRRSEFLTCACLFLHRTVPERLGLLDERYFLGGEEWEYSRRMGQAGLQLWVLGNVRYLHRVTGTHVKYSPRYIYNGYRTKLMFMKSERPWLYLLWSPLFRAFARWAAVRHFRRLAPELRGREPAIREAIGRAFLDHRRYRSLELAHLERFPE